MNTQVLLILLILPLIMFVLVPIAFARLIVPSKLWLLALFRIFEESFFGNPKQVYQKMFQPLWREKLCLFVLVAGILINGIRPQLIPQIFKMLPGLVQSARAEEDGQLWTTLITTGSFGKDYEKYKWYLEGQTRVGNDMQRTERSLMRGALGYNLIPGLIAWMGYGWTPLYINSKYESEFKNENRIWEQLTYDNTVFGLPTSQRLRLEQRIIEGTGSTANRLRYMYKMSDPIWQLCENAKLGITGYHELFVNLDSVDKGPQQGYDRNRIFFGPYYAKDKFRAELGYLNEYARRPGNDHRQIHALAMYFFYNF